MGKYSLITIISICWITLCIPSNVFAEIKTREVNCSAIDPNQAPVTINEEEMATFDKQDDKTATSIYDFTVKDTFGNDVPLEKYRGNVVLIVNIASQCGLTKNNYAKLTKLHNDYYDKGLRILSFPCNQFGSQMPEQNGEEMVCHLKAAGADVGDVFAKINVNGDSAIPLYKYLKQKQGGFLVNAIKWNFTKFLVDKNGQPVARFSPTTDPEDLAKEIEKLL